MSHDYVHTFGQLSLDLGLYATAPGEIFSDLSLETVRANMLLSSFYKKLSNSSGLADKNALEKFKRINSAIPTEFCWNATSLADDYFLDYFLNNFRECISTREDLDNFDIDWIREHMLPGPGAAQKAVSDAFYPKLFESSLSYTNADLIRLYRSALAGSGLWADAEMRRFERFGFTKVEGGKLFFAPKNADISRTCCTEASLNMLVQKAIGDFLEYRLVKFFGINLSTQPDVNRELARLGSIDCSFGTIDLVSASDSISASLCSRLFSGSGLLDHCLRISRSEFAVLPDGSNCRLNMVSTMGNGFTFPLQTLIFACMVKAVYQLKGIPLRLGSNPNFAVFGDDIIVCREAYDSTISSIQRLGFEANEGKSFNTGLFRESCGEDYFAGSNVRGVYIRSLDSQCDIYSAINRLLRWSSASGIALNNLISHLLSLVPFLRVPVSEADTAGIKVPSTLAPKPSNDGSRYYYRRLSSKRNVVRVDESSANPYGLVGSSLSGYLRRRDVVPSDLGSVCFCNRPLEFSLRENVRAKSRYRLTTGWIWWWDYYPPFVQFGAGRYENELVRVHNHRTWEGVVVATLAFSQG